MPLPLLLPPVSSSPLQQRAVVARWWRRLPRPCLTPLRCQCAARRRRCHAATTTVVLMPPPSCRRGAAANDAALPPSCQACRRSRAAAAATAAVGTLPDGYLKLNPLPQVPTRQSVPTGKTHLPTYFKLPQVPPNRCLMMTPPQPLLVLSTPTWHIFHSRRQHPLRPMQAKSTLLSSSLPRTMISSTSSSSH